MPTFGYVLLGCVLTDLDFISFLFLFLVGVLLIIGTNSMSEAIDFEQDRTGRRISEIVKGNVSIKNAILQGLFAYSLAFIIVIVIFGSSTLSLLVLSIILIALVHITPPIHLKKRGFIGTAVISLLFCLLFLLPFTVNGKFNEIALAWFSLLFLNTGLVMTCKDFKDYEVDKKFGVKTPVIILGPQTSAKILIPLLFLSIILSLTYVACMYNLIPLLIISIPLCLLRGYLSLLLLNPIENAQKLDTYGRLDRTIHPLLISLPILFS